MLDGFEETPLVERLKWVLAIALVVFLAAPSFIVIPMTLMPSITAAGMFGFSGSA